MRGIDAQSAVSIPAGLGQVRISLLASYLARHDTQLFPGGATLREAGTYAPEVAALPRGRMLTHADFDFGAWHLSYGLQWIGGYQECNYVFFQNEPYCRRVEGVLYHDLEGRFESRSFTVGAGVTNITDRLPPHLNFGNEANTDTGTYRLLGRTFYAGIGYRIH